jgi:HK97 family phage prohead protease
MVVNSPQFSKIDVPVSIKTFNEATGVFEGYASTWNVDLVNDRIKPGAFSKTISEAKARQKANDCMFSHVILWQHQHDLPIGGVLEISEDRKGLHIVGQLDLDTELGRRAFSGMRKGYLRSLSIGYKSRKDYMERGGVRVLEDVLLIEISLVTFPANPEARIGDIKGDETAWALQLIHDMRELIADYKEERGTSKMREEYERPLMPSVDGLTEFQRAWREQFGEPQAYSVEPGLEEESRAEFERGVRAQLREDDPELYQLVPGGRQYQKVIAKRQQERVEKQRKQREIAEQERREAAAKQAAVNRDSFTPTQFAQAHGLDERWCQVFFAQWANSGRITVINKDTLEVSRKDVQFMVRNSSEMLEAQLIKAAHKRAQEKAE